MGKILVAGSLNMDLVVQASRLPLGGETIMGHGFSEIPGGKGANQAVAMARLGADVTMIGKVGTDGFGQTLIDTLKASGANVDYIGKVEQASTGVALITVQDSGENSIIVVSGANGALIPEDLAAVNFKDYALAVTQLETPMPTVIDFLTRAKASGSFTILNPAPAKALPESLYASIDLLTPNETELASLTGMSTDSDEGIEAAAKLLLDKGLGAIVITLGARGSLYLNQKGERHFEPARRVKAVDTTAAGDSFTGGLAVSLANGETMAMAMAFATKVASLTVQTLGAQSALPYLEAVRAMEV